MKIFFLCLTFLSNFFSTDIITPHKFTDEEMKNGGPVYNIPTSCRFVIKNNTSEIIYYFSKPKIGSYPIAILCGGSSSKDNIFSIIHFHRYLLKEFLDLNIAVITIEQKGVDGNNIDKKEFIENYTRSNRLNNHETIIESLIKNPPSGWNKKFIFLGVSEGGPIVTTLSEKYTDCTIATINWSGAGDLNWKYELWDFIKNFKKNGPFFMKILMKVLTLIPDSFSFIEKFPKNINEHNLLMKKILNNPIFSKFFMRMTYKYHADALTYPKHNYSKIKNPYLVVTGALDSILKSSNLFVKNGNAAGMLITYFLIEDMDHYIRKRPDIQKKTFEWLEEQIILETKNDL